MADGAMGEMLLAFLGLIAFFFGLLPILLVAFLAWRSNPGVWSVGGLLTGSAEGVLAAALRRDSELAGASDFILLVAILCSVGGLVCLVVQKRRGHFFSRFSWVFAAGVVFIISVFGFSLRGYQIRSEEVLALAGQRHPREVARLLEQGADPDCMNGFDCGLDRAIANKDWETTKVLIQYGATPTQHNADGDNEYRSLKLLEQNGQDELARRLRANGEAELR